MAFQKTGMTNDQGKALWYDPQTGNYTDVDPSASQLSGPVTQVGSFQGESAGGADFNFANQATPGIALADQGAGGVQYNKQLDDAFQKVWQNPNASSWDKAMAVQTRYGVEALSQLAQQGYFSDIGQQLGSHISGVQNRIGDKGFSVAGNPLGLWPVALGTAAFAGLAGAAGAEAGAGGGSTAGSSASGLSGSAGGEFTGGLTGTATGSPGFSGAAAGSPGLSTAGATGSLSPGFFAAEGGGTALGGLGAASAAPSAVGGASGAETGALSAGGGAAAGGTTLGGAGLGTGLMSNPSLIGGLAGAGLGALSGTGSKQGTITTEEGIPDWLMPYVKPTLDKYSTDVQNFQTDPYGIMPSAMQQFQKTIQGDFLSPDSNPYLNDYFRLGAERIKGSLSPTFGHMQAFGQHSGYNEALARGLGDFSVQLYGGAYDKERERQNQLTAAAPAFLGQNSQAQFQPFSQYLSSVGSLGKSKESPFFTNPFSSILGGAMVGSQFGKMF